MSKRVVQWTDFFCVVSNAKVNTNTNNVRNEMDKQENKEWHHMCEARWRREERKGKGKRKRARGREKMGKGKRARGEGKGKRARA
jgi:hypothetical protein